MKFITPLIVYVFKATLKWKVLKGIYASNNSSLLLVTTIKMFENQTSHIKIIVLFLSS